MDGLTGGPVGTNGTFYTPLNHTNTVAGNTETITSFDAVSYSSNIIHVNYTFPSSIATKPNTPLFDRPNGSGAGRTAFNDQVTNVSWWNGSVATSATGAPVPISSSIDFVRSSSLNTAAGSYIYIPIAQDAVTYAEFCGTGVAANDCTSAGNLTSGNLTAIYATTANSGSLAPTVWGSPNGAGGAKVEACTLNTSSGTYQFWGQINGNVSRATMDTNVAPTGCGKAGGFATTPLEENDLARWLGNAATAGSAAGQDATLAGCGAAPGCIWIVPFSMGQVISQHNGAAPDAASSALATAGVHIGMPNDATTTGQVLPYCTSAGPSNVNESCPVIPTAPNWAPQRKFYQSKYGRYLFVFMQHKSINGPIGKIQGLIDLFSGGTAAVCNLGAGQATQATFGFDSVTTVQNGIESNATGCGDSATFDNLAP
jgi:hypothetical protein